MRKRIGMFLVIVFCCMVFQPLAYAQGEVQSGNNKNLETYSARYIVKYADAQPDTDALQKKAKAAFQKAKQQKEEAMQTLSEEAEQEQNERTIMKLRIKEKGMEDTVETTALTDTEEAQQYEMIRLEEAVQPETFMEELQRQSGRKIEYIQPDYVMSLENYEEAAETTEPEKSEAAAAEPAAEAIPAETPISDAAITTNTDNPVIVALLDTGVDVTHPALAGHLTEGYDFYNNTNEIKVKEGTLEDVHGTHIAGVIAQTAPNAKIMPLKIFDNGKAYTSDIIRAIGYAEEHGAAIVNCSWGSADNNTALREVMEQSDMFFVCAAGNHRKNLQTTPVYPAAFGLANLVSVASLNQDLGMSYFSNYGESVDIAAIGRDVESTYPNGETGKMNGTSVSAGFVSGAAAVYAEMYQDTSALKEDMKRSADKLSCLQRKVEDGNSLNLENLLTKTTGSNLQVYPEDDFDVLGYERTPAENWELFSSLDTVKVAVGTNFSLFLKSDGSVWACGNLENDVYAEFAVTPIQIPGLRGIVDIAAGYNSLALRNDGTVYQCGFYEEVPIPILDDVKAIASSETAHCLAIKNDGSVWGWGENEWGQAGGDIPIVEDTEWGSFIVGFQYVSSPTQIMRTYTEPFTDAKKVYGGGLRSYILDENDTIYVLGCRGLSSYPDTDGYCAQARFENVKEFTEGSSGMSLRISLDGKASFYEIRSATEFDASQFDNAKAVSGNLVIKEDGTVWRWSYDSYTQPDVAVEQITGIDHVASISYGSFDYGMWSYNALMIKEDGTVWGIGDNSCGELGNGTNTPVLTPQQITIGSSVSTKKILVDEQYASTDNPAYQANQEKLESMGWSAYDEPNKSGNNWQSPELGTFDAQTGQLIIKKTGDINTPTEAPPAGLVYAADKTFNYRQDNWLGDSRVSVWTQHFKGDYEIELKGSFQQTKGQVYYDVQGYRNNGSPCQVARYKINPGVNGYINVYNNRLNGGDETDYPIILNPRENRTIQTVLHSETALYQTYVDNEDNACLTTVENAEPKHVFNMTGWNENQPGAYMTGIRITAQKQTPQNETIAAIDSVKLVELNAVHDIVDEAIAALSMDTLTDTPENVTIDLKPLPDTLAGADITWTSSKPELIANDGKLIGLPSADTTVVMTAKITNPTDGFTKYMEFHITVAKVNGFRESYINNITGTPSGAGVEGTKTFAELPMWNFTYPGINNGTNGEVHAGQVLVKDGYLTFKKISDRQTDNYNECVVGIRSLSNTSQSPAIRSARITFAAMTEGTGTMRFAPLTTDGKPVCTVVLDSSARAINVVYGEQNSGSVKQVTQRITNINPRDEHQYTIQINADGTFVVEIDGTVIKTETGVVERTFLPGTDENSLLSHMKVWITNITKQNTEIGKLKNFSVMDADAPITLRKYVPQGEVIQVVVSGKSLQNILTKTFAITYNADDLELIDAYAPTLQQDLSVGLVPGSNMNITELIPGSLKFQLAPNMGTYTYWGGVATILKFRAKRSAVTVITLE